MTPPAPVRLSTTNCWPHFSESFWAIVRAVVSVPAPGANGTIMRTGLSGYFGAGSLWAAKSGIAAAAATLNASARMVVSDMEGSFGANAEKAAQYTGH